MKKSRGNKMDMPEIHLAPNHQVITDRFVAACQADERVVAAILGGSYARGAADTHSDLDLYLVTTDEGYETFLAERDAFVQRLGKPLFYEDFGSPGMAFLIFPDGAEVELGIGRAGQFKQIHEGPYITLLDKTGILEGVVFPRHEADPAGQTETLRQLVTWFWHDLSHFTTALARGQLWWAHGQLEVLRLICVNLARLRHNFSDVNVGGEGYFKVEKALPVEQLAPLQATCSPLERDAMLQAALAIVRFYREQAQPLAQAHGLTYPADLDRVMVARLEKLGQAD
jgi:predicted nucleotidyltransferase